MKYMFWKNHITVLLFIVSTGSTSAQIIRAGIKAGPQLSWVTVDDPKYKSVANVHPVAGFHAGFVLAFKVKDRYFLNTEYIYSQKGKSVTGKIDPVLNDKVVYRHIDIPILFSMHFKGHLGKTREFKWYLNAGPNTSYWLGGKGVINAGDLIENGVSPLKYKIAFGSRILFEPELGIGYRVTDRVTVEASWVHVSNAGLLAHQNPGMDSVGVRLSYRLR